MQSVQMQLAKELAKECRTVEDIPNKLKELFKDFLQQILEAEMAEHLAMTSTVQMVTIQVIAATDTAKRQLIKVQTGRNQYPPRLQR